MKGNRVDEQVLIQWQGADPEDSSWELISHLTKAFPSINLEDKIVSEGEGDVARTKALELEPILKTIATIAGREEQWQSYESKLVWEFYKN